MIERPILFSGEMVRAILAGRKTQTRRVVTVPWRKGKRCAPYEPYYSDCDGALYVADEYGDWHLYSDTCAPYGRPGDALWVRETWCPVNDTQYGGQRWIDYRATPRYSVSHPAGWDNAPDDPEALRWRPSIHMPRWASRIDLEVTGVRVERLQAITGEDALAEGVAIDRCACDVCARSSSLCPADSSAAVIEFMTLWDRINAKRGYGWETNPWVWGRRVQGA